MSFPFRFARPIALLISAAVLGCAGPAPRTELWADDPVSRETWETLRGAWTARVGESRQRVHFRFEHPPGESPRGWYDMPDQRAIGIPVTEVRIEADVVRFELASLDAVFEGRVVEDGDALEGTFEQGDRSLRVVAARVPLTDLAYLVPRWGPNDERQLQYTYRPPAPTGDGWDVGRLDVASIAAVTEVCEDVLSGELSRVEGVVVAKHGVLLVDEYFYGFDRDRPHALRSVTKTMASVLTGVALQQGYLAGVDTPLVSFFPELAEEQAWTSAKREITLEHLLTMTSGLEGNDWRDGFAGSHSTAASSNWLEHVLARRVVAEPGERFAYSGSSLMALSGALEVAAEAPVPDMAARHLFDPMQFGPVGWRRSPAGTPYLGSGMSLRPRDLAKIGQLYLDQGRWRGRQLVPASWVVESTRARRRAGSRNHGYGCLWWSADLGPPGARTPTTMALGLGGQYLFVVPERELVVVITSGNYDERSRRVRDQGFGMLARLMGVCAR